VVGSAPRLVSRRAPAIGRKPTIILHGLVKKRDFHVLLVVEMRMFIRVTGEIFYHNSESEIMVVPQFAKLWWHGTQRSLQPGCMPSACHFSHRGLCVSWTSLLVGLPRSVQKYRYSFRLRLEKMMAPNMSES
jgi:hypothetical protein